MDAGTRFMELHRSGTFVMVNVADAGTAFVSFPVPVPERVASLGDRPFFTYRRIAGRPLSGGEAPGVAAALGSMLAELRRRIAR